MLGGQAGFAGRSRAASGDDLSPVEGRGLERRLRPHRGHGLVGHSQPRRGRPDEDVFLFKLVLP